MVMVAVVVVSNIIVYNRRVYPGMFSFLSLYAASLELLMSRRLRMT